ncbi:MAG: hypothetical protein OEV79_10830 [candidate division WOR-3 bacterium]|nr:hypothetical protein [candidate division WOR-3 bacterium]
MTILESNHGGNIRATIVPGRGHRPPSVEEHEELFYWFLEQKRHE